MIEKASDLSSRIDLESIVKKGEEDDRNRRAITTSTTATSNLGLNKSDLYNLQANAIKV